MRGQAMALYDDDFYEWCVEQARLLRERRFDEIDLPNVIEEIESLGASHRTELSSHLEVLLVHLLKQRALPRSPDQRGWWLNIREQRRLLRRHLRQNPSLQPTVGAVIADLWEDAREAAMDQTDLPATVFPTECPWTAERVLDPEFYPEDGDEPL